jgi:hypothetical protein
MSDGGRLVVRDIADRARAFKSAAKLIGATIRAQNAAVIVLNWARRREGQILEERPKQRPGEYQRFPRNPCSVAQGPGRQQDRRPSGSGYRRHPRVPNEGQD